MVFVLVVGEGQLEKYLVYIRVASTHLANAMTITYCTRIAVGSPGHVPRGNIPHFLYIYVASW